MMHPADSDDLNSSANWKLTFVVLSKVCLALIYS